MVNGYQYNEDCSYIPVHMNAIFNSKWLSFEIDLVDEVIGSMFIEYIRNVKSEYIIIDLDKMKTAHSRVFEEYSGLSGEGKNLVFVNADDTLLSHITGTITGVIFEDGVLFSTRQGQEYYDKVLNVNHNFSDQLKYNLGKITADYLKNHSLKKDIFLESSNIYSNMYVDVKQLFNNAPIYLLTVYRLCKLIDTQLNKNEYDGFICASNNGSVLSTMLTLMLNKKSTYIMNLGPHLTIMDKETIDKIKVNGKYAFIFDFVCLGTELKLVKTVVSLQGAKVVGMFGVAKHHPERKYDPTLNALVSVNDDYDFGYIVSIV